jgi:gamma-glutamyltranspeptidase / glutathione hydrolase
VRRLALPAAAVALATAVAGAVVSTRGNPAEPPKQPVAVGVGGAVSTVDSTATAVGLEVLREGGNAVDAAVAAAATLGVTEPFSAGIGGGGFLMYYDAKTGAVKTIDGRESAPASMTEKSFVDPATGDPYAPDEARVSGLSVGVPSTLLTWRDAIDRWGSRSLADLLKPAAEVAEAGFAVDQTFADQITADRDAFGQFTSTSALFLPRGRAPAVGSTFRNPDLAETYELIARGGTDVLYRGQLARDIVRTVQEPPLAGEPVTTWRYPVRPGGMTLSDLAGYRSRFPKPTRSDYRGLQMYGMPTPSSGGTTVGEALNILEQFDLQSMTVDRALHHYLEASALAYADRNRYVGGNTPQSVLRLLLSDTYAKERACRIDPTRALPKPVPPGVPDGSYGGCASRPSADAVDERKSTTNLTVADRWGNVVEYTLTIEQTGGNAMVVPGRGFLLNNELSDFNFTGTQGSATDPNLPAPGRRPRSSISPTIVLSDGKPFLAVGTPGGATIITTVLQILVNRIDLGMALPEALAAPRASQRNGTIQAEPAFIAEYRDQLPPGHAFSSTAEIGAATGIEFLDDGRLLAAAETVRRGGGAAAVVEED